MNSISRKLISIIFIVFFVLFVNTLSLKALTQKGSAQKESDEFILFIVDFSNSMTEKLHGTKKINMVLDTMQELLPKIPPDKRVGLRVYGHKGGIMMIRKVLGMGASAMDTVISCPFLPKEDGFQVIKHEETHQFHQKQVSQGSRIYQDSRRIHLR